MPVLQQLAEIAEHTADAAWDELMGRAGFPAAGKPPATARSAPRRRPRRTPRASRTARSTRFRSTGARIGDTENTSINQRHQPGRLGAGVEVADDRARDHAHCRTDPLQEAKRDQPADGRRKTRNRSLLE